MTTTMMMMMTTTANICFFFYTFFRLFSIVFCIMLFYGNFCFLFVFNPIPRLCVKKYHHTAHKISKPAALMMSTDFRFSLRDFYELISFFLVSPALDVCGNAPSLFLFLVHCSCICYLHRIQRSVVFYCIILTNLYKM